ncbi:hypothetical protein MUN74_11070 [Agromyces endophyticus]|uniref:hypothetical protein n=1 Tax=Agromyces sp. H17E-10 TaxID=2932244 RepID=UPI001FD290B1|nr:hypothetical protein [Agromyces sp. H17E-10]UOQ87843.1 hypothetical protein MUN74_11070 [Agromyces sp. H17E-10]
MKILHPDSSRIGEEEVADDELVVATTRGELATMAGAINEALEAVDKWEFGLRLGVTPAQATELRDRLNEVLRVTYRPE